MNTLYRTLNFDENRETIPVFIGRGPRSYGRPSPPAPLTQVPCYRRQINVRFCMNPVSITTFNLVSCKEFRLLHRDNMRQYIPKSPQECFENQRDVEARTNFCDLKRQSSSNVLNCNSSDSHANFCFSSSNILDIPETIPHCVSADFIMQQGLAWRFVKYALTQKNTSRITCLFFDKLKHRYIYILVTKTRFFHRSSYESIQLSLIALR